MIYIRRQWDGSYRGHLNDLGIYGETVGETADDALQASRQHWGDLPALIFIGGGR